MASRRHLSNQRIAPNRAINRPAKINGVGHDQHIVIGHVRGEGRNQFSPHLAQRAKPMGLKQDQQPPRKCMKGLQRRRNLIRIMAEIINHGDPTSGANHLKPTTQPVKPGNDARCVG